MAINKIFNSIIYTIVLNGILLSSALANTGKISGKITEYEDAIQYAKVILNREINR